MIYKKGDRIKLLFMGNDPDPVPAGTEGTVDHVCPIGGGETQLGVSWDNGRTLNVILPEDRVAKI